MGQATASRGVSRQASFFSASLLLHIASGAAVIIGVSLSGPRVIEEKPEYLDLGYEQLDEPPPAEPKQVVTHHQDEPVPKEMAPAVPAAARELQDASSTVAGTQSAPPPPAPATASTTGSSGAPQVPFYKIKPKYPRQALLSGAEGFVDFKIDISESGEVENVRSLGGTNVDMFEMEARRALVKWKYRPFTDEAGHVVRKSDHVVRIEFKLEEIGSS